jgi:iron(III) transport system substrate-binding protein
MLVTLFEGRCEMIRPTLSGSLGLAIAVALLLAAGRPVRAADPQTVAKITNYAAADRSELLLAGARKEGELQLYTVGSQIDAVTKAFGEKYPFLSVQVYKADIPQLLRKLMEEYRAGLYNADAFELDDYGVQILRDQKILTPFYSPESANYGSESIEKNKHWVLMREDYASLGFNTASYPPDEAPHSHADLLDPKWKGKLGVSASESTLTNWIGAMVTAEGEDFVRKLGPQRLTLYNMGGPAAANLVVSGEVPLLVNSRYSHIYARKKNGGKVAWRALGPSYTVTSGMAVAARAKNPHAAMLFVDYMLSAEAQKIYTEELGYASLRKDMLSSSAPTRKLLLALSPNYQRDYEQWGRLADQVFRSGR